MKGDMLIQWFPGHMVTAQKRAAETMAAVDLVVEVLDARIPYSSCNPLIEALRKARARPALKLLNKADLADPRRTQQWLAHYNAMPGVKAIALSGQNKAEVARITALCRALAPHRGTHEKQLRMMIMGVPNVGKSTLMNTWLKRRVAKVGDEPAVTKHQQRIEIDPSMSLVDTPGMLWPKLSPEGGLRLAACNAVGRAAFLTEDVAVGLADYLLADYPKLLSTRYGAPPEGTRGRPLLAWIAAHENMVETGGLPDLPRASRGLLADFHGGALGRITLETPEQVAARPPEPPFVEKKKA